LLAVAEIAIFFRNPRHFFMGDSLFWMQNRYRSFGEFLRGFVTVDPAVWYRPLSQRTVVSALFPLAGFNPVPYRIVGFLLFFSCTVAVFLMVRQVTESSRTAWFAVLLFAPHVINAFVTYDVAYTTELVFALFYVGAAIAFVAYLRSGQSRMKNLSALLFVCSLLSKETAAALPAALLVLWLFLPGRSRKSVTCLFPYFAILGIYLVFAVGYLHVRDIRLNQLIDSPGHAGQPGYQLVMGRNVIGSASVAFSWAFGLPGGDHGQWVPIKPWMLTALRVMRVLVCVGAAFVLFTPRRNLLFLGIGWFLATVAPTLPLLDHFLPYYIFVPMAGFSLAFGVVLDWAYEKCATFRPALATALTAFVLALFAVINAGAAGRTAANHYLLGGSATIALNSLNDVRSFYPEIPKGTTMVFFNEERPTIYWDQANGALFAMVFRDPSLEAVYTSGGVTVGVDKLNAGRLLAFHWAGEHLSDMTPLVRQRPDLLQAHAPDANYHLELSATEVRAGQDSYTMQIGELPNSAVEALYAIDGVIKEPIHVKLGADGATKFDVGRNTQPGLYTFVAVRREGESGWIVANKSIIVK